MSIAIVSDEYIDSKIVLELQKKRPDKDFFDKRTKSFVNHLNSNINSFIFYHVLMGNTNPLEVFDLSETQENEFNLSCFIKNTKILSSFYDHALTDLIISEMWGPEKLNTKISEENKNQHYFRLFLVNYKISYTSSQENAEKMAFKNLSNLNKTIKTFYRNNGFHHLK